MTTADKTPPRPQPPCAPTPEQMQAAYQCHTLAQIVFRQLAASHPWIMQARSAPCVPPMAGYAPAP